MKRHLLVLPILCAALAACEDNGPDRLPVMTPPSSVSAPIVVSEKVSSLSLAVTPARDGLSETDRLNLDRFLVQAADGNPEAVHLTVRGAGADVLDGAIGREAVRVGIDPTKISADPARPAAGARMIEVTAHVYSVATRACPDTRHLTIIDSDNTGSSNFGCASAANLAAMIADPRDLSVGESGGRTDSEISNAAILRLLQDKLKKLPTESGATPLSGGGAQ